MLDKNYLYNKTLQKYIHPKTDKYKDVLKELCIQLSINFDIEYMYNSENYIVKGKTIFFKKSRKQFNVTRTYLRAYFRNVIKKYCPCDTFKHLYEYAPHSRISTQIKYKE